MTIITIVKFLGDLSQSVPVVHRSWQGHYIVSSFHTEVMYGCLVVLYGYLM